MRRNLLLLSNSSLPESSFLEWAADIIKEFLSKNGSRTTRKTREEIRVHFRESTRQNYFNSTAKKDLAIGAGHYEQNVKEVLFIPYALSDLDAYSNIASSAFKKLGYHLTSIHKYDDPVLAVQKSQAIFVGGGNTFRLLKKLYDFHLIEAIKNHVLQDGVPYIGSSAGTNVSAQSINTTNDMPIVYPPSFEALSLIPFNINPHYIDPDPFSKHMGETREERIKEYHEESLSIVVGLREGSLLHVADNTVTLKGLNPARIFARGQEPKEFETGSDLSFLLTE